MVLASAGAAFPWHAWKKSGTLIDRASGGYYLPGYTTLYSFSGTADGGAPKAGLLAGPGGSLIGTTSNPGQAYAIAPNGGTPWTYAPLAGLYNGANQSLTAVSATELVGVEPNDIFTLTYNGSGFTKAIVWQFQGGVHGTAPTSPLLAYNNRLFFGTASGGANGGGVLYELANNNGKWALNIIYSFTTNGATGSGPSGALAWGTNYIALFGTTTAGGANGNGTLYNVAVPLGTHPTVGVLHNFTGGSDGAAPNGVITDAKHNIFGTTSSGGVGFGTVYELPAKAPRTFSTLYTFVNAADGTTPNGPLAIDAGGALYGTTASGSLNGVGAAYVLAPPATKTGPWRMDVLHAFNASLSTDGASPAGGVLLDTSGNIYGVTSAGGAYGKGSVYEITP